jgi:hypothetical protein
MNWLGSLAQRIPESIKKRKQSQRWQMMVDEAEIVFDVTPTGPFYVAQLEKVIEELHLSRRAVAMFSAKLEQYRQNPRTFAIDNPDLYAVFAIDELEEGDADSLRELHADDENFLLLGKWLKLKAETAEDHFDRVCEIAEYFQPGVVEGHHDEINASALFAN